MTIRTRVVASLVLAAAAAACSSRDEPRPPGSLDAGEGLVDDGGSSRRDGPRVVDADDALDGASGARDAMVITDGAPGDGPVHVVDAGHDAGPRPPACDGACTDGTFCAVCSGPGPCRPTYPPDTICPSVYLPECGCNGRTYSNACARHVAGIGLAHGGEC